MRGMGDKRNVWNDGDKGIRRMSMRWVRGMVGNEKNKGNKGNAGE